MLHIQRCWRRYVARQLMAWRRALVIAYNDEHGGEVAIAAGVQLAQMVQSQPESDEDEPPLQLSASQVQRVASRLIPPAQG